MKMREWFNKNTKWIFTIPVILFVVICIGYPICYALYMSFHAWRMSPVNPPEFVGLANYVSVLQESRSLNAITFTFKYFIVSSIAEIFLGVSLALILSKVKKARGVIRTAFLFPMVATPVAIGYVWRIMFDSSMGLFNSVFRYFGLKTIDFFSAANAFRSLMVMEIWMGTPLIILIVLAGISGLSNDYYESAKIDGANGFQTLFKITLPLLTPTITMAFLLRGIEILKIYDLIMATTEGGPQMMTENMNYLVYTYAFEYMQMGKSNALMIIFFLIVMAFALTSMAVKKRMERRYE